MTDVYPYYQSPRQQEYYPQDIEYYPQDIEYQPQDIEHQPQDIEHQPQDIEHQPQDIEPQDQQDNEQKLGILLALISIGLGIKRYLKKSPVLESITISTSNYTLNRGSSRQLNVICKDTSGNIMQCPPLLWSSSSNVSVTQTGYVTALTTGLATVIATDIITNKTGSLSLLIIETNIYLSPSGNDTNPGTQSQPVKTFAKALDLAITGDVILALNGTYSEQVKIEKSVSIYGQDKNNTIIDGTLVSLNTWPPGLVYLNADNVIFSGFKVQNPNVSTYSSASGILAWGKQNITIENNHVYHTQASAITVGNCNTTKVRYNEIDKSHYLDNRSQEAMSIQSNTQNFDISYNYLHHNGIKDDNTTQTGNGGMYIKDGCQNGVVHHNYITQCLPQSIYLDGWCPSNFPTCPTCSNIPPIPCTGRPCSCGPTNTLPNRNIEVYQNIVDDFNKTLHGNAYQVVNEQGGSSYNINIHDNIAYGASLGFATTCGGQQLTYPGNIIDLVVRNNVFYKNVDKGIYLSPCPTYSNANIRGNISCNNIVNNIFIDTRIPNSTCQSYNCDILTANNIINNYISDTDFFNLYYNPLKTEIFSKL